MLHVKCVTIAAKKIKFHTSVATTTRMPTTSGPGTIFTTYYK